MIDSPTVASYRETFVQGHRSAKAICDAAFEQVTARNPDIHSVLALDEAGAMATALALDARTDRAAAGPLAGVPLLVKENICMAGVPTRAGSRVLEGFVSPYDATVVSRLRAAGALIIGTTNCDEFAMGSSTEFSATGPSRNPWDTRRTPGGSSGGSAAGVSARLAPIALGSDTGGSVRQPAGFCGITGIKPTYGRVSRFGLIAFASSLDQVGAFGLTVRDAATLLEVIAGVDPHDATSARIPVPAWSAALTGSVAGLRIGVPESWLAEGVEPDVLARFRESLAVLEGLGAQVVPITLAHVRHAIPVYYVVATAEASSNLARFDGIRYGHRTARPESLRALYERTRAEGFGPEVIRRILMGTFVLSAGYDDQLYVKALQVRTLITRELEATLESVDVIATPTSPTVAFPLGERLADPVTMYLADVFTVGASLAGLPALSVPCGFDTTHLPVGLQLTGRRFDEGTVLRVADAYEREQPWWTRVPPGLSS